MTPSIYTSFTFTTYVLSKKTVDAWQAGWKGSQKQPPKVAVFSYLFTGTSIHAVCFIFTPSQLAFRPLQNSFGRHSLSRPANPEDHRDCGLWRILFQMWRPLRELRAEVGLPAQKSRCIICKAGMSRDIPAHTSLPGPEAC
jgi:hypothetical protein